MFSVNFKLATHGNARPSRVSCGERLVYVVRACVQSVRVMWPVAAECSLNREYSRRWLTRNVRDLTCSRLTTYISGVQMSFVTIRNTVSVSSGLGRRGITCRSFVVRRITISPRAARCSRYLNSCHSQVIWKSIIIKIIILEQFRCFEAYGVRLSDCTSG
jgi:hypothetical protein